MPIINRLSECGSVELLKDEQGAPMLEFRFKFVRYQLILDDDARTRQVFELLGGSLAPPQQIIEPPKIPKLYARRK